MNHINAKLTVSGDMSASVSCDCNEHATVSVGTVAIRDGTDNYEILKNKPSIEDVELVGNKALSDFGFELMTVQEIEEILYLD